MVYLRYVGHPAGRRARRRPADLGDARAARHPERVPRRLPGDHARGDGGRARWCSPARSSRELVEPHQRARRRSPRRSPARTPGCSAAAGAASSSTARRSTSGSSATWSRVDPAAVLAELDAGRIPVVSSIAPDLDDPGPVAQRQRRLRRGRARRRARRRQARHAHRCRRASTATGRTATRSSPQIDAAELARAAAEPRVGHDPEDDRLPRRRRRRRAEGGDHRRPRAALDPARDLHASGHRHRGASAATQRTSSCSMSQPSAVPRRATS